jgi:hypothetical protein
MNRLSTTGFYVLCVVILILTGATFALGVKSGKVHAQADLEVQAEEIAMFDEENSRLRQELEQYATLAALINCESDFRHDGVWGDQKKAYGILQFHETTFYELADRYNYVGGNWEDAGDQLAVALEAIRRGEHTRHWTCAN